MAKQINVFVENKPGRLNAVTDLLASKKFNILFFAIQDRGDFGLVKLLVDRTNDACLALQDAGYAAAVKEVILIVAQDKPGNLHTIGKILEKLKINLSDARGFVHPPSKTGACCLEVGNVKKASAALKKAGFKLIEENQL
jgi:hypothetical protein